MFEPPAAKFYKVQKSETGPIHAPLFSLDVWQRHCESSGRYGSSDIGGRESTVELGKISTKWNRRLRQGQASSMAIPANAAGQGNADF